MKPLEIRTAALENRRTGGCEASDVTVVWSRSYTALGSSGSNDMNVKATDVWVGWR